MAEVLLVNPHRRGKKRRKNPSRIRRKMTALQRKYFGPRRKKHRASNPHHRSHRAMRRRHRNPSLRGITGQVMPTVKAGFIGAGGALGLDLLWGYGKSYLPASMQSGATMYAAKALGAVLIGVIGGKVLQGRGTAMAQGAMTVVLHEALKAQLMVSMPSLPLGQYLSGTGPVVGYQRSVPYSRAVPGFGARTQSMGQYLSGLPCSALSGDAETYDT